MTNLKFMNINYVVNWAKYDYFQRIGATGWNVGHFRKPGITVEIFDVVQFRDCKMATLKFMNINQVVNQATYDQCGPICATGWNVGHL